MNRLKTPAKAAKLPECDPERREYSENENFLFLNVQSYFYGAYKENCECIRMAVFSLQIKMQKSRSAPYRVIIHSLFPPRKSNFPIPVHKHNRRALSPGSNLP